MSELDEQQAELWPSPRAYAIMEKDQNNKLWITQGAYSVGAYQHTNKQYIVVPIILTSRYMFIVCYVQDTVGDWTYYDGSGVYVFNLNTLLWESTSLIGAYPNNRRSASSAVVNNNLYSIGGCNSVTNQYYNDLYILQLDSQLTVDNIEWNNTALFTSNIDAGTTAYGILQFIDNSGNILSGAIGLENQFDIQIITVESSNNQFDPTQTPSDPPSTTAHLATGTVTSMNDGRYNMSFIPTLGTVYKVYISFAGQPLINSPFTVRECNIVNATQCAAYDYGVTQAEIGMISTIRLYTYDTYGNMLSTGGLTHGNVSLIAVYNTTTNTSLSVEYTLVDHTNGSYTIQYYPPNAPTYELHVLLNGVNILHSPYTITTVHQLTLSNSVVNGIFCITLVAMILTFISSLLLYRYRSTAHIKRSSPIFLQMQLVGSMLCYCSILSLLHTTITYCQSQPYLLGLGLTLIISPLLVKNYRIAQIFNSGQLKIVKVSNRKLSGFILISILVELCIDTVWLLHDPITVTNKYYSFPSIQTYSTCTSQHTLPYIAVSIGYIGVLLLYGVLLAVQIRGVPQEFNESSIIGACIYNITATLVTGIPMLLFVGSGEPSIQIITQSTLILWICVSTTIGMISTKLYYAMTKCVPYQINNTTSHQTESYTQPVNVAALNTAKYTDRMQQHYEKHGRKIVPNTNKHSTNTGANINNNGIITSNNHTPGRELPSSDLVQFHRHRVNTNTSTILQVPGDIIKRHTVELPYIG